MEQPKYSPISVEEINFVDTNNWSTWGSSSVIWRTASSLDTDMISDGKDFICQDCGRGYKLKSSLRNHQKWECGKEPQFQCPYCQYKAKQKMHVIRHIERVHSDKNTEQSKKCTKRVRRFVRTHGPPESNGQSKIAEIIIDDDSATVQEVHYLPEIAVSELSDDDQYQAHDTLEIPETNYELTHCPTCERTRKLLNWNKFLRCDQCKSTLQYRCERCDKRYKGIKALRWHIKHDCDKEPQHQCPYCIYRTTRKASLQLHLKCKHTDMKETEFHKCSKCNKRYKHRFHMLGHEKYCGEKNIHCEFCDYSTNRPECYKMHIRNMHTDPELIDFYECELCGKKYKHQRSFQKHLVRCLSPSHCDHCDFVVVSKKTLIQHIKKMHKDIIYPDYNHVEFDRRTGKRKSKIPKRYTD